MILSELPQSRYGRTLKPPLCGWAGQMYRINERTGELCVERGDLGNTPAGRSVSRNSCTPRITFRAGDVSVIGTESAYFHALEQNTCCPCSEFSH